MISMRNRSEVINLIQINLNIGKQIPFFSHWCVRNVQHLFMVLTHQVTSVESEVVAEGSCQSSLGRLLIYGSINHVLVFRSEAVINDVVALSH